MSTRAERPRTLDPYVGSVLGGRHRIEKLIGRGGMGLVYLATDTTTNAEVVVKLLAPHWLEDATAVSRFDREGKRLQQLAHPNVVQLIECARDRGQAYIVMEYLDGEPLRRFLKRSGPLTLAEFTPIAAQILAAVGYAHDRSIMLRDIKPANIMLCERDGKANFVKVLDFGLAKLVDGDDEEVTKSHVIGTAGYLAPELIKGEPSDVRVDVYAIGVLLFSMLAGESPIQGENDGALLYNHVHGTPRRLESLLPAGHNVPDALVALVHQCLEKDPTRRPADANEVAEALFESVPPRLFALPAATTESRKALADYRSARDRGLDPDAGPQSSEWTKPVVRPVAEPSPAEASAAALPRPRRGTPALPPPRRPSQPDVGSVAGRRPAAPTAAQARTSAPPVRLSRPTPVPVRPVVARGGSPTESMVAGPAVTAVSTPRPADTAVATETITPIPYDSEVESGPIPVTGLPVRRRWFAAAAVLALALGGLSAWAIFGPGGPAAPSATEVATAGTAAPSPTPRPTPSPTPSADASSKPPVLTPISVPAPPLDDEPVVVAPEPTTETAPVVIRGPSGARVEIDGADAGAAPLQTALVPGKHDIRVVMPGHTPWAQSIEVVAGQNPIVEAKLRPIKKRKGGAAAVTDEPQDEPEPASEPLPDKPPPISTTTPSVPRPPPPPPPPSSDPFLPTK